MSDKTAVFTAILLTLLVFILSYLITVAVVCIVLFALHNLGYSYDLSVWWLGLIVHIILLLIKSIK